MQTAYAVRFKRWDWDYFLSERKKVLELWPTGAEIASEDALARTVEYHKQQPWYKFASLRNAKAEEEERIQITPQVGHALVDQTIEAHQVLRRSQARSLVRADRHLQPQESVRQSAGCRRAFETRWLLVSERLSARGTRRCRRASDQRIDESRGRDRQQRRGRALQLGDSCWPADLRGERSRASSS